MAYLEEVPDHAYDLGLLGRCVGHALMCTSWEVNSHTLPCLDKPVFQVPSLGKPAPNVEANLSKPYVLLELLCSLKERCKHAYICSWSCCAASRNDVIHMLLERLWSHSE